MSAQPEPPEQEDFDKFFTVFDGSSPEDVSHARQLWSSLSLLPPLESRLVSADIRQRLPVSRPQQQQQQRSGTAAASGPRASALEPLSVPALRQRQEERQRYAAMADQRREILALLRRQREQRIQKELPSVAFKPKVKLGREKVQKAEKAPDSEMEKQLVRQLQ
ncbi:cilia- and flagella-associated protein HOATZ [Lates calcarifer]|uniref:Cilia- and flagella-associated protein HOATZ n=1 Tax=Lates calcarifer TaxID=8187 RepID=A0AAJ7PW32_LATCA|nr:cilia- and flagella-associated protein HOATZ [Lates calcarifer]